MTHLTIKRIRQADRTTATRQIVLMQAPDGAQMVHQWLSRRAGRHGRAILISFRITHTKRAAVNVNVLDTQPQAFQKAQAAAIEQTGHQRMHAGQSGDDLAHLIVRKDGRQAFVRAGANGVNRTGVRMQRLPIQKQQGSQRLVLSGGGDAFVHCQMRQKSLNLSDAHLIRVTFDKRMNRLTHCTYASSVRINVSDGWRQAPGRGV